MEMVLLPTRAAWKPGNCTRSSQDLTKVKPKKAPDVPSVVILIFVRELVSPSFVCFSLLHYAGDLWVQMSVLVSRIDLLFASGSGEKTQSLAET